MLLVLELYIQGPQAEFTILNVKYSAQSYIYITDVYVSPRSSIKLFFHPVVIC
jgi:hypothetical protein